MARNHSIPPRGPQEPHDFPHPEVTTGEQIDSLAISGNPEPMAVLRVTLQAALQELSHDQRQVVLLHVLEDYSFEEIAAILGKHAPACRQAYHRAMKALKKTLEENF